MALPQTPDQWAFAFKDWKSRKENFLSGFTSFPMVPRAPEPCTFTVPRVNDVMQEMVIDCKTTCHIVVSPEDMEIMREHQDELRKWLVEKLEKSMLIGLLWPGASYRAPSWNPRVGSVGGSEPHPPRFSVYGIIRDTSS